MGIGVFSSGNSSAIIFILSNRWNINSKYNYTTQIVIKALEASLYTIADNAGLEGAVIVHLPLFSFDKMAGTENERTEQLQNKLDLGRISVILRDEKKLQYRNMLV